MTTKTTKPKKQYLGTVHLEYHPYRRCYVARFTMAVPNSTIPELLGYTRDFSERVNTEHQLLLPHSWVQQGPQDVRICGTQGSLFMELGFGCGDIDGPAFEQASKNLARNWRVK